MIHCIRVVASRVRIELKTSDALRSLQTGPIRTMTSSGDEFDAYNFQEFTADDLASLDSILARGDITPNANMAGPAVTIEVEQPANHPIVNGSLTRAPSSATGLFPRRDRSSPFQQYRWKKVISVSDLVSPAWYVAVDSFATNPVNDEI